MRGRKLWSTVLVGLATVALTHHGRRCRIERHRHDHARARRPAARARRQIASTSFDLATVGYEQAEYLFGGTATTYTSAAPLTDRRQVEGHAPARRRRSRPAWSSTARSTAKDFNGTVIVEWNNVSGGLDAAPIWLTAHDELIREGYAWVGVTAQRVGVEGGGSAIVPNLDLKHADPERYGTLVHPGDSYSYDMYRQAGEAVRDRGRRAPRRAEAEARDRGRRVAVGVPHDHLHRRRRAAQQGRVRRLLRVQPRRRRRHARRRPRMPPT